MLTSRKSHFSSLSLLLYPEPNWKLFIEFQHDRKVFLSLNLSISDYNWSICYSAELVLFLLKFRVSLNLSEDSKKKKCICVSIHTHTHFHGSAYSCLNGGSHSLMFHVEKDTQRSRLILLGNVLHNNLSSVTIRFANCHICLTAVRRSPHAAINITVPHITTSFIVFNCYLFVVDIAAANDVYFC